MRLQRTAWTLLALALIGWLGVGHAPAQGARVAGEEGVVSSSSEAGPETPTPPVVRPSPTPRSEVQGPPPVRPPAGVPARRRALPVRPQPAQQPVPDATQKAGAQRAEPEERGIPRESKQDSRYVTIDFDDVDIGLFIKFISELTGKNFVVDKRVQGKVTIISPTKITVAEAYKVFESVLEVHGFAAVPAGNIIKIVPAVEARSKDVETRTRVEAISPEDRVVTQLIRLNYADPTDLSKLFAPLISKTSVIVPYPPTGMVIVTDVLSNIRRLLTIVEAIDVEGIGEEISVIPLKYATASVLGKSVSDVFQKTVKPTRRGAPTEPQIKIVADDRTNALIILASEDDTLRIRQLIYLLDKETPRGEGDIHVYYLQHANAEELVKVLMAIPSKQATGKETEKGKAPIVSKEVQVVADKATNSLVITANKEDFLVLEDVIRKLDIARRMVYIEALFMEVTTSKTFDIGVEWQAAETIGSHDGRDVVAYGSSFSGDNFSPVAKGFSFGVLGDTITIGGVSFPSVAAVVKAMQTDSDVRILSTPQILTTDNEEAEITVGKNVPYVTSRQQTTTTGTDYSQYEYKDVGVTLKLTPQINQERLVRLKVTQEVTQLADESLTDRPTTFKRLAKTTVIVKDGSTVVIGGLIDETTNQGQYMVPCLGGMPGLGWLFKSVSSSGGAQNLYVFLTPRIIENPSEAKKVYEEKKEEIDQIREGAIKMYKKPGGDQLKPEVKGE